MSVLQILQYPDLRLRRKAKKVSDVKSKKIQKILDDMLETLKNTSDCAALSATQLDIDSPPDITVINNIDCQGNNEILILINLQILSKEGTAIGNEGCMSICPSKVYAKVKRAAKISIKALDRHRNNVEFETEGFLARCIQHEYDHLRGVLYIDHLAKSQRTLIEKQIQETESIF